MFHQINFKQKWHSYAAILLLALTSPYASFSATDDDSADASRIAPEIKGDEIKIQANYMKLDLATESSIYKGNVTIIQGTIKLTGDNVTVSRKDNEISDIEIDGNPARYLQDGASDNNVHAFSQHMKYNAKTRQLVMTVDASLKQSDHTVTSQRIVYDTQNKIILAGKDTGTGNGNDDSSGNTDDRVNIILTPKKEASPTTGKPVN